MRSAHGSGVAGLAGMAAVRPEQGVRLLRPLLCISRQAIRAWLTERGQSWLEDPSNDLAKFERVRIRQSLDSDKAVRTLDLAAELGPQRDQDERDAASLLAEAGQIHDAGYVSVSVAALRAAEARTLATVLRQIFLTVSGRDYAPPVDGLVLSLRLNEFGPGLGGRAALTLGGCLVQVLKGRLNVFREAAGIGPPLRVSPGWTGIWDNRFGNEVASHLSPTEGWALGPLGEQGLRQAVERFGARLKRHPVPLAARLALPALWRGEHLVCQPHLKVGEGLAAWPAPRHTVTTCGFTVAVGRPHTIYSSVPS